MTDLDSDAFSVNVSFCRFCDAFLIGKGEDGITTVTLDSIAGDLALDEGLRCVYAMYMEKPLIWDRVRMGANKPSIWPGLHQAWDALALAAQVAFDEGNAPTRSLVISFARFTRNLVAAVPSNQQNAL